MALTMKDQVYTWGYNHQGQLGHGYADEVRPDSMHVSRRVS